MHNTGGLCLFPPWRPFPHPRKREYLCAPLGPGVQDLRPLSTKEPVLFGIGGEMRTLSASSRSRVPAEDMLSVG